MKVGAKGFSELKKDFSKYNADIVGISADNQDSHESFCSEKSINYTFSIRSALLPMG